MASFDYGIYVYHNGEELPSEYELGTNKDIVRLGAHKMIPEVFLHGKKLDNQEVIKQFARNDIWYDEELQDWFVDYQVTSYYGELEGYTFEMYHFGGTHIDMRLVSPLSGVWTARAGYSDEDLDKMPRWEQWTQREQQSKNL